jgi:hypothetical protein
LRTNILKQCEIREQEEVRFYEIMKGHSVGEESIWLALSEEELHILKADIMNGAVYRTV